MTTRASLWGIMISLFLALAACQSEEQTPLDSLQRSCAYLWTVQDADGGWHSATHSIMLEGQVHTPFILFTLLQVPDSLYPHPKEGIQKGLQFVRNNLRTPGMLGNADPIVLEYPVYATSYGIRLLREFGAASDSALIDSMSQFLLGQQFTEQRGIAPDHLAYGSWGFGETRLVSGQVGQVDLSHTRKSVQALSRAGKLKKEQVDALRVFLHRLQNQPSPENLYPVQQDGGFFFSNYVPASNKTPWVAATDGQAGYAPSYATATCEGILTWLACGEQRDNAAFQAALDWLRAHPRLDWAEGIDPAHPNQWHEVLVFYHLWVRAEVYHRLGWKGDWRQEMMALLRQWQQEDGSFANPAGARNKEDDPLLATAMAVDVLRIVNEVRHFPPKSLSLGEN